MNDQLIQEAPTWNAYCSQATFSRTTEIPLDMVYGHNKFREPDVVSVLLIAVSNTLVVGAFVYLLVG